MYLRRIGTSQATRFLHRKVSLLIRNSTWITLQTAAFLLVLLWGPKDGKEQEFRMGLRIIVCAPIDYNNGLFCLGIDGSGWVGIRLNCQAPPEHSYTGEQQSGIRRRMNE